jgi:uncharacterized membrane protein YbhN (UPF0104 family)
MWAVQKIAMRAERWGPVITSQLASNSFGRVVPGGVAAAGAMQYAMLARGGVPAAQAASGMTASSILVFGILLALPLLALPAVLFGAPVDPGLGRAALIGGVVFVLLTAAGVAAMLWDRPLLAVGRAAQSLRNRVMSKKPPLHGLPSRLLRERNDVRDVLGARWWEALLLSAGRWVLDYRRCWPRSPQCTPTRARRPCCSRSARRSSSGRCRSRPAGSGSSRRD